MIAGRQPLDILVDIVPLADLGIAGGGNGPIVAGHETKFGNPVGEGNLATFSNPKGAAFTVEISVACVELWVSGGSGNRRSWWTNYGSCEFTSGFAHAPVGARIR